MKQKAYFPKELQWMWNARYGSWRVSDAEIFDYSAEDYEKKAAILHEAGINTVITFTFSFHFQWDWQFFWPELLEVLSHIVAACHKYDIKVIEHHSSTIKSYYPDKKEIQALINRYQPHNIDLRKYPRHLQNLSADPVIEGIRFSAMYQVDIRTGKPAQNTYHGYTFCPNNPDFQRVYFGYLEKIYRTGVDGIMTDDIQFMPYLYSCGCRWCRKLFTEQSGYRLPATGSDDRNFFLNFDNPAFRAFIRFREATFADHHRRVNQHFQKLGYVMARPNYCSSSTEVSGPVGTGYDLEGAMPYFNTAFTEVCSTENPLNCWAWLVPEFKHKSALARRYHVPAMVLFYCTTAEQGYFSWALSKVLGQSLWVTGSSADVHKEAELSELGNAFQKKYPDIFDRPASCSRIAVLFSRNTMTNYQAASDESYTYEFRGWCQQLFLNNLLFDVVLDEDLEESATLQRYDLLILPNAACLNDRQVENIKKFVNKGGKIIATFETGHFDHTGNRRKIPALQDLFGVQDLGLVNAQNLWKATTSHPLSAELPPYINNRRPYRQVKVIRAGKILLESVYLGLWVNTPICITTAFGKGKVTYFSGYLGNQAMAATYVLGATGLKDDQGRTLKYGINKADPSMVRLLVQSVKSTLGNQLQLSTDGLPEGVLIGLHKCKEDYALHLLNASGTLHRPEEIFGYSGKWEAASCGTFKIKILFCKFKTATLISPDFTGRRQVPIKKSGDGLVLTIKKGWLRHYSVIRLR
ncbi:MAG: beta-galactosidase trimerization domain-containing protein [Candidatus Omnitrophota bacterium]